MLTISYLIKDGLDKSEVEIFIEENLQNVEAAICGKLVYSHKEGDKTYYNEINDGCIWVYLTDCRGKVDSGMQHNCKRGNVLYVQGCHAFGCRC